MGWSQGGNNNFVVAGAAAIIFKKLGPWLGKAWGVGWCLSQEGNGELESHQEVGDD